MRRNQASFAPPRNDDYNPKKRDGIAPSRPTFVSRWSRRRERPGAKRQELSGRSQRGDSAWCKTLDHLLSLLMETLSIGRDSPPVKGFARREARLSNTGCFKRRIDA